MESRQPRSRIEKIRIDTLRVPPPGKAQRPFRESKDEYRLKVGLRQGGYSATKRLVGATACSCEFPPRLRSVEDRRPSHGSARAWPVGEVRWRPSAGAVGTSPLRRRAAGTVHASRRP